MGQVDQSLIVLLFHMEARIGKHAGDNLTLIALIFVMIIPILLRVGTLRIALVTIRTSINVNQSPAIIRQLHMNSWQQPTNLIHANMY